MSYIPRIFLPDGISEVDEMVLDEPTSHYLSRVLRLEIGNKLIGFDGKQKIFQLRIMSTEAKRIRVKKTGEILESGERSRQIALGQSLPKAAKFDLILRQGTEVGVHRFIPLVTHRSVSRPEEAQFDHKRERWLKILAEACRQCGRNDVPVLDPIRDWDQGLEQFGEFDLVLIPYEKEAPTLRTVLESHPKVDRVLALVGPEGGWSPDEIQEARKRGAHPVHLPTPILRTETAGLVVVAMIQYELGDRLLPKRSSE